MSDSKAPLLYMKDNLLLKIVFVNTNFFNFFPIISYTPVKPPARQHTANTPASVATIVAPTGVPARIEIIIPLKAHTTEMIAEQIVTVLKLLNSLMDESAGKIISADISREPTRFIASTMITAITDAIIRLYVFTFVPVALAKVSSKVIAKILL